MLANVNGEDRGEGVWRFLPISDWRLAAWRQNWSWVIAREEKGAFKYFFDCQTGRIKPRRGRWFVKKMPELEKKNPPVKTVP